MDIWNIITLLGDIELGRISFGQRCLNRINAKLDEERKLSANITGDDLRIFLEDLPRDTLHQIEKLKLLTPSEVKQLIKEITSIRQSDDYRGRRLDKCPAGFTATMAIVSIAAGSFLILWFIASQDGFDEPVTGVISDGASSLLTYMDAYIRKYLGIK